MSESERVAMKQYAKLVLFVAVVIFGFVIFQQAVSRGSKESINIRTGEVTRTSGDGGHEIGTAIGMASQGLGFIMCILGLMMLLRQVLKKIDPLQDVSAIVLILIGIVLATQHWAAIIGIVLLILARLILSRWPTPPTSS